jgi:hypothetical protein
MADFLKENQQWFLLVAVLLIFVANFGITYGAPRLRRWRKRRRNRTVPTKEREETKMEIKHLDEKPQSFNAELLVRKDWRAALKLLKELKGKVVELEKALDDFRRNLIHETEEIFSITLTTKTDRIIIQSTENDLPRPSANSHSPPPSRKKVAENA